MSLSEQVDALAERVGEEINAVRSEMPPTGVGHVAHGSDGAAARPSGFAVVYWVGSAEPQNRAAGDVWLDTSGA